MRKTKIEMRVLYAFILTIFIVFLALPLAVLFIRSLQTDGGMGWGNYRSIAADGELLASIWNSIKVSGTAAFITTITAFLLAYAVNCTNMSKLLKRAVKIGVLLPMLLPTITYGFAIMYSFGNQGLMTKLLGGFDFNIYGFNGLLTGYCLYTLPPAFLLIDNALHYIDKKFMIVSKLMGDRPLKGFLHTVIRPLWAPLAGAFVLAFVLSFTDFGIPASIGGTYPVIATGLYQVMLGSIPDFNGGAAIAVFMLLPAVFAVILLRYMERFNFHYDTFNEVDILENKLRDTAFGAIAFAVLAAMVSVFAVMFIAPFAASYPYDTAFTLKHFTDVLQSSDLMTVYKNSLLVAAGTAVIGTIIAYTAALINARTAVRGRSAVDFIAVVTNTVPGMVLGIAYLLLFAGSSLKGTFFILIICTVVHYFATPYLLAKNALSKMNPSWETTGELLGDSWLQTVYRVVIPNSWSALFEMFSYYFINAMVTISGISRSSMKCLCCRLSFSQQT